MSSVGGFINCSGERLDVRRYILWLLKFNNNNIIKH